MAKFNPLLVAMTVMFAPQSITHAASNCNAGASLPWKAGKQTLTLEAISNGPECGKAIGRGMVTGAGDKHQCPIGLRLPGKVAG